MNAQGDDTCERCGGDGEYQSSAQFRWADSPRYEKCSQCRGTGRSAVVLNGR